MTSPSDATTHDGKSSDANGHGVGTSDRNSIASTPSDLITGPDASPDRPADSAAEERAAIRAASRVVIKVGSSSLTDDRGDLNSDRITELAATIADVRATGKQVVLITSGAIAAGLRPLGMQTRPHDLASQQAAASVGQGLLLHAWTQALGMHGLGVGQVLLTVDDMTRRSSYRNAVQTLERLLELRVVPIINENDTVATHEIRFGDNDRLAALVAHVVKAQALVLLSDVEALYTAHPETPGARRIERVDNFETLQVDTSRLGSAVGTGGMATKLQAAQIATSAGIPVVLTAADQAREALLGRGVGTVFAPMHRPRPRRLLWLAHATEARGRLHLDAGAVRALLDRGASLLAVGVRGFSGDFVAGDPVDLVDPDGHPVARGLVGFDADEMDQVAGRSSAELAEALGPEYERVVVHRDAMVLLDRPVPGAH